MVYLLIWLVPAIVGSVINFIDSMETADNISDQVNWDEFFSRWFCILIWPLFIVIMLFKGMLRTLSK